LKGGFEDDSGEIPDGFGATGRRGESCWDYGSVFGIGILRFEGMYREGEKREEGRGREGKCGEVRGCDLDQI